jgi:hypothetical protein
MGCVMRHTSVKTNGGTGLMRWLTHWRSQSGKPSKKDRNDKQSRRSVCGVGCGLARGRGVADMEGQMNHELREFITASEADDLVALVKAHRHSGERCEAVKRYLLPLAHKFPVGVTVDDVAYCIVSRAEKKQNGTAG